MRIATDPAARVHGSAAVCDPQGVRTVQSQVDDLHAVEAPREQRRDDLAGLAAVERHGLIADRDPVVKGHEGCRKCAGELSAGDRRQGGWGRRGWICPSRTGPAGCQSRCKHPDGNADGSLPASHCSTVRAPSSSGPSFSSSRRIPPCPRLPCPRLLVEHLFATLASRLGAPALRPSRRRPFPVRSDVRFPVRRSGDTSIPLRS